MKKAISVLMTVILLMSTLTFAFSTFAADVVSSGFCGAEGNEESVRWALDTAGTLTLSGSGDMEEYDPAATGIYPPWHEQRESILKVVIENGITRIGARAFKNCRHLEEAIIPASVESIGYDVFWGCVSLPSIYLPEGLKEIRMYAFALCLALESVTIPASVSFIEGGAFEDTRLTSITVRNGNPVYYSEGNCVIARESKKLVVGLANSEIPTDGSVDTIGQMAFMSCNLDKIEIPDCINCIETDAYWGLRSEQLPKVIVPESVVSIHNGAFSAILALKEIELPSGLTFISNMLFSSCRSLEKVTIPNGVTRIGWDAFKECIKLKSINIPRNVEKIGEKAFYDSGLEYVFYEGTEEEWNRIDIASGNEKLLNASIHFNSFGHTPGSPEREIFVAPTCVEPGSYDEVVFCTQCGLELSRNHVTVTDPTNHKNVLTVDEVEATHNEHGFTAGEYCSDCGMWISGHEIIHNTDGERIILREPTEDENGLAEIYCTVCGEKGLYSIEKKPESEDDNSIISQFRKAVKGIIDWFLRLIKWLGGNKKK